MERSGVLSAERNFCREAAVVDVKILFRFVLAGGFAAKTVYCSGAPTTMIPVGPDSRWRSRSRPQTPTGWNRSGATRRRICIEAVAQVVFVPALPVYVPRCQIGALSPRRQRPNRQRLTDDTPKIAGSAKMAAGHKVICDVRHDFCVRTPRHLLVTRCSEHRGRWRRVGPAATAQADAAAVRE